MLFALSTLLISMLASAAARDEVLIPRELQVRQSSQCYTYEKACGVGCIDLTDTCCPDGSGGCPLGSYCTLGNNGAYGCCQTGKRCSGAGGAITSYDYSSYTYTATTSRTSYSSYSRASYTSSSAIYTTRETTSRTPLFSRTTTSAGFGDSSPTSATAPATVTVTAATAVASNGGSAGSVSSAHALHAQSDLMLLVGSSTAALLSLMAAMAL